jgi:hypothetical protein
VDFGHAPERDMDRCGFFRRQIGAKREVIALPGLIGAPHLGCVKGHVPAVERQLIGPWQQLDQDVVLDRAGREGGLRHSQRRRRHRPWLGGGKDGRPSWFLPG